MLIVCCGMYRSGSTLQYNIVRRIVEDHGMGHGEGWLGSHTDSERFDAFTRWVADDKCHIAKVHNLTDPEIDAISDWGAEKVMLFNTYRDLRDIAVSLQKKFKTDDEAIIVSLDEATRLFQLMSERLIDFLFVQKYEEMNKDLKSSVIEHAEVIGAPVSEDYVETLTRDLSIESVESNTKLQWVVDSLAKVLPGRIFHLLKPFNRETLYHIGHVSDHKGKEGIWKSELSHELAEQIENRYETWLSENSYV